MRIGLLVSNVLYPLAGQAGVSERLFSSAANVRLQEPIEVQTGTFVRGENGRHWDRKNLRVELSFETVRTFSTAAAARVWAQDYSSTMPRSGTLMIDTPGDNSTPVSYIIGAAAGAPILDGLGDPVAFPLLPLESTVGGTKYAASAGGTDYELTVVDEAPEGWIIMAAVDFEPVVQFNSGDGETAPESIAWAGTAITGSGTPVPIPVRADTRFITNAIVYPPERRINGASVSLYYRVLGSAQSTTF